MGRLAYKTSVKVPEKRRVNKENIKSESLPNSAVLGMLGNSSNISSEDSQLRMETLRDSIQSRLPSALPRQTQIPEAENEADRLSASLTTGTPDSVKATMSQKLGADFSKVRIHTDSESATRADAIGARAFTMGSDIYFGSGGFDPSIAAHELVHTAQQGVVTGAPVAASAPLGSVQMWPWDKKKKDEATHASTTDKESTAPETPGLWSRIKSGVSNFGSAIASGAKAVGSGIASGAKTVGGKFLSGAKAIASGAKAVGGKIASGAKAVGSGIASGAKFVGGKIASGAKAAGSKIASGARAAGSKIASGAKAAGSKIAYGADKLWDITGGRLGRWNREAIEEYTEAQDNGDWNIISGWDKAKWIMRNPIAWASAQKESNRQAARDRMKTYAEDDEFVRSSMGGSIPGHPSSMIDGPGPDEEDEGPNDAKKVFEFVTDKGGIGLDIAESTSQLVDKAKGLEDDSALTTAFGHSGNTLGIVRGIYDLHQGNKEQKEQKEQGLNRDARRTRADMAATAFDMLSNAAGYFNGTGFDITGGVLGGVAGVINLGTGVDQALAGRKQRTGSKEVQASTLEGGKTRKDLADDELFIHDTAVQSAMSGRQQEIEGTGKAISGVIDTASAIADASGAGAAAGAALTGAGLAVKAGTAAASKIQHNRLKAKVTEQTIGPMDPQIEQFLAGKGLKDTADNRRRAKRAIVRVKGKSRTGHREGLFRAQTSKRGNKLAEIATIARNKKPEDLTLTEKLSLKLVGAMGMDAVEQEVDDPANPGQKIKKLVYSGEGATTKLGSSGSEQEYNDSVKSISAAARRVKEKKKKSA